MRWTKAKKLRRLASLAVAAVVFSEAGSACFAADGASLAIVFNKKGNQAEVVGENMTENTYAAQAAIPVSPDSVDISITPADIDAVCEIKRIGGEIVIYLDHTSPIVTDGKIAFGTISASSKFDVGSQGEMLFADELLQGTSMTVAIDVTKPRQSSSSSDDNQNTGSTGGQKDSTSNNKTVKPTVNAGEGGSVKVSADGNTITITPDDSYVIKDVIINGKSVGPVSSYTFDEDDKKKDVKVVFQKAETTEEKGEKPMTEYSIAFADVPEGHWARESINFVVSHRLFFGTDETSFSPDASMTRAMFVAVMSRFETALGSQWHITVNTSVPFTDVPADAWYGPAVAWGSGANLVNGTGEGRFSPDAPITREQIAVLLVHYADLCGITLPQKEEPVIFTDVDKISPWAKDAVRKAQTAGILYGRDNGTFGPQDIATRAEVASMLERFINSIQ